MRVGCGVFCATSEQKPVGGLPVVVVVVVLVYTAVQGLDTVCW